MSRRHAVCAPARVLLALLALLWSVMAPARADTPIALWKSFDGRVNFTGTQVSLRTASNTSGGACTVSSSGTSRNAKLTLPAGAEVMSAQLYWAGSGVSDSVVTFEGKAVTATRKYSSTTIGGGYNYFGGAADVTALVKAKGGGTYAFSGLTVSTGKPWCASQGVLGGFALLVVYSHKDEPERVLNLYEGFRFVQNAELTIDATNFRWPATLWPVQERARIGHITWEGDPTLAQDGERLRFEGREVSDALNPEGNQFNSRSNINHDSASYGIDFDAYDTTVTIWAWFNRRVTTSYRTGQDLVLLNAEILVVPTMPVSDLSIALARPGSFMAGRNTVYTVDVTNNGPYTEAGPVTVTNTLPAGLAYVSGSGTNWTCSASGQVVTCAYKGAIAPGTGAAQLAITARVNSAGEKINTATVKGTDDDDPSNNSASHKDTAIGGENTPGPTPIPSLTSYVFTEGACLPGIAIGAAGQTCRDYAAATRGGSETPVHLTAVINGVPAPASTTTTMTPTFQFALECVMPLAGSVGARYAGTALKPCADGGLAWSDPVKVTFAKNAVSVSQPFVYHDVGKVRLSLKEEGGGVAATREFVVAPLRLAFESIRSGKLDNPGNTDPGGRGFVPAGTMLTVRVGALLQDEKTYAPNFRESETSGVILEGAAARSGDPGSFTERDAGVRSGAQGFLSTQAAWSEVGGARFVARLFHPDDGKDAKKDGAYLGVEVGRATVAVGRFYPAYFTTLATGPFDCPQRLPDDVACPNDVRGAVYSGQPFGVTVRAFNAANEALQNFAGDWFRPPALSAVNARGGAAMPLALASDPIKAPTRPDPIRGSASYRLPIPYASPPSPPARPLPPAAWSPPTPVFVRAAYTEDDTVGGAVTVTSLRPEGEVSEEGGILVLSGRLKVSNVLSSDLLRTRVPLVAQYWAGTAWLDNPAYADTAAVTAGNLRFIDCKGRLALKDAAGNAACDLAALGAVMPQNATLTGNPRGLQLRAPGKLPGGATRSGSAGLQFDGWPWLPSTTGRVTFGIHRSPVIYMRELYF